jgi:hypothetical protein
MSNVKIFLLVHDVVVVIIIVNYGIILYNMYTKKIIYIYAIILIALLFILYCQNIVETKNS